MLSAHKNGLWVNIFIIYWISTFLDTIRNIDFSNNINKIYYIYIFNNFVLKCQILIPLTTYFTKINPKPKVLRYVFLHYKLFLP